MWRKLVTCFILAVMLGMAINSVVESAGVRKSIRQWLAELPVAGRMYTSTTTFVEDDAIQLVTKSTLPTSGYLAGALIYCDGDLYLSTATVTTASCWVAQ